MFLKFVGDSIVQPYFRVNTDEDRRKERPKDRNNSPSESLRVCCLPTSFPSKIISLVLLGYFLKDKGVLR